MTGRDWLVAAVTLLPALTAAPLAAQGREGRAASAATGVVAESWRFATPLPVDSGLVDRVTQFSIPIGVAIPLSARWTADVSGAYTIGSARLTDSLGGNLRTLDLRGPTDMKLRVVGRLVGDALIVTAGVNAPTGLTQLGGDEVTALRLIGAPPLRMPSPTLGSGLGATAGVVVARQVGPWAVALGGSYEARAAYSPIDVAAAGAVAISDLDPSNAAHLTLGADRLFGEHRVSLLGSYDLYGEDRLTFTGGGATNTSATFQLGPTVAVLALIELGVPGMRELSISAVNRYRAAFTGIDGETAVGSSGNSIDARIRARWGGAGRVGVLLGAEGRFDTGLDIDASLAAAAMTAFGGTLGVSLPLGGISLDPAVRAVIGTIDTGDVSTRATSLNFTISLGRR